MNSLTKGLVVIAVVTFFGATLAASPRSMSFDEVVKKEAKVLKICKKEHGIVSTISSAEMDKGFLHIKTPEVGSSDSMYEMKAPATAEQLKSLVGKKTCVFGDA